MSGRRAKGEGSVSHKPRKDGRYQARMWVDDPESGEYRRVTVFGRTRLKALDALRKLQDDAGAGLVIGSDQERLDLYLERWLEGRNVRPATRRSYEGTIRVHIVPTLGAIEIGKLTKAKVLAWLRRLETQPEPVPPRSRQLALVVLRAAIEQARKDEIVARNVAALVDLPRVQRRAMLVWSAQQVGDFLQALQLRDDRLYALYLFALSTGMRQGELFALRWGDLDLDRARVSVQHTLDRVGRVLAEPKTAKGRRRLDLSPSIVAELRRHRERMQDERVAEPWVFPAEDGKPLRPPSVSRSSFVPAIALADAIARDRFTKLRKSGNAETRENNEDSDGPGVPLIRFHDLRHTAATMMLEAGIHPRVVQERLGHATIAITLDTYSHVSLAMQSEAAAVIESVLAPILVGVTPNLTPKVSTTV